MPRCPAAGLRWPSPRPPGRLWWRACTPCPGRLYILGYGADDSLMVASAVAALGSRMLGERGGQRLKLLSGAVMVALGAVLLLRPHWLLGNA